MERPLAPAAHRRPPDTEAPETRIATWLGHRFAGNQATPECAADVYAFPPGSADGSSLENHLLDWLSRRR